MSAIDVVFRMLKSGDHVVAGEDMYGGSYRLFSKVLEKFGLQFTYVDTTKVAAVRDAIKPETMSRPGRLRPPQKSSRIVKCWANG